VLLLPPLRSIPVPIGAVAAIDEAGVFGLLLSWIKLNWISVQESSWSAGQAPFCGDGRSKMASVRAIGHRLANAFIWGSPSGCATAR
jgi:hypothetical protein